MAFFNTWFCKKVSAAVELEAAKLMGCIRRAAYQQSHGHYREAIAACDKVLGIDPTDQLTYRIWSVARYGLGDMKGSLQDWEQSLFLAIASHM